MTAFSGCVELLGEDPGAVVGETVIAKKVVWSIDDRTFDDDATFEDMVKTRLEYTHHGSSVPAGELVFAYLSERGAARENPGTQFTAASDVRDGDVITISAVNITSGLVVRHGNKVLAERAGIDADWFRVDNGPIPIASSSEGRAQFEIDSSAGFRFNATGIQGGNTTIHRAVANVQGKVTGPITIDSKMPSEGPRIELRADLVSDLQMMFDASVTEDGTTYEAGMELRDFVGELEGMGMLQFDSLGRLIRTGDSGRIFVDGTIHMWDQEHPRSSNYEPEDMDHPWISESEEYGEHEVDPDDDIEAWLVDFLTRLWSMEVAVGDDYRFHFEHDGSDGAVEFDYIIQIVAEEARDVGGKRMPAYRVSQLANLVVDFPNGLDATFDVVRGTYWVSKESYLPIYAQVASSRSFNRADAEKFLMALDEDVPYELPETFVLVLSGEQVLRLTSYSGDFTISPIVGVLLGNSGSYGMFGGPSMFLMRSAVASSQESYEAAAIPMPPRMAWSVSEIQDTITVTMASDDADWSDLAVRLLHYQDAQVYVLPTLGGQERERVPVEFYGYDPLTAQSIPVLAGDQLKFCVDGVLPTETRIDVLHVPTYQPLFETSFANLAPCA